MALAPPTPFEAMFARRVMITGAVSSSIIVTVMMVTGVEGPLVGVGLGFLGSSIALAMLWAGHHHRSVQVFLISTAISVWIASGRRPDLPEALGAAATSWLLLGIFASLLLPRRTFILYGVACWIGVSTLTVHVALSRTGDRGVAGGTVAVIFVAAGFTVLGRVAQYFRDTVAASQAAEQRALDAAQTKARFLANMSHELRTPLNAILGYSEILLEDDDGAAADDINRIHTAGTTLLGHINALLDLSKIDAGRMEVYLEPVDVGALLHEVIAMYSPLFDQRGNRVELRLAANVKLVSDRAKLSQILTNLLTNANKFTENGTITVTTLERDDNVELVLRDTGIGIASDLLPRLFDAFSQADSSTTRQYGGTGLGLALVREFCSLLGGTVTAESQLGEGATFTVILPKAGAAPTAAHA